MDVFSLLAVLVTATAVLSWFNHRFVRLPNTIGLMVLTLLLSLALVVAGKLVAGIDRPVTRILETISFDKALLEGLLGALLFAGALHLNLNDLLGQKWVIGLLATLGVVLSTAIVGLAAWLIFQGFGLHVPPIYCLLFGALISPTDPIAVGSILKRVGVPRSLMTKITGESLFNDGAGVVLFLVLLGLAGGGGHGHGGEVTAGGVARTIVLEIGGGLAFGVLLGWIAYRMLRSIDNYQVEILITLAIVTGGYAAALALGVSGPLAMVAAGLLIGNRGRRLAMSEETRDRLDRFWELIDELMNAGLFVLVGAEFLILELNPAYLGAGLVLIPTVLLARGIAVSLPVTVLRVRRSFSPHVIKILTWSGLRGAISVALALSLPRGPERDLLVTATYIVVCFSIIVQGLTVGPFMKRVFAGEAAETG